MNQENWKIYLPICGIKTRGAPFLFDDIGIEYSNKGNLGLPKKTGNYPYVSEEADYLCITTQTEISNRDKAIDYGLNYLEDALSILRSFIGAYHGIPQALGLISLRHLWSYSEVLAVSHKSRYREQLFPRRRQYEFRITDEIINQWIDSGLNDLLKILKKKYSNEMLNNFEELIISSFIWCGGMLEDQHPRDILLRGVSSIESITLHKRGKKGISRKIGEYGAALVISSGEPTSFQEAKNQFQKLYKSRCKISHGSTIESEEYLKWMNKVEILICTACKEALKYYKKGVSIEGFFNDLDQYVK